MTGLPWTVALLVSTLWIIYRVYLVFQKPVEELEEILGLDVPPQPEVTLSAISSTTVSLYWKPPDHHSSVVRSIQVNGINIGPIDRALSSVAVNNLKPGSHYGIRAVATNEVGNSSTSRLVQVQTIPEDGHQGTKLLAIMDSSYEKPKVPMRRDSHAAPTAESSQLQSVTDPSEKSDSDSDETVARLTKKLDSLRRQKEEIERQLAEEIEEAENSKATLTRERDDLRGTVEEKEKASLEFKKQVNELEKQCKAAQRRKSAKERALQQKKSERQKMKDEMSKWEFESLNMRTDSDSKRRESKQLEDDHAEKMANAQQQIREAHAASKVLEEEIQNWGKKIKILEEDRKRADREQNEEEQEADRREKEEELVHEAKVQELQATYAALWRITSQAEVEAQQAQDRLNYLQEVKAKEPSKFGPLNYSDYRYHNYMPSYRRSRHGDHRASSSSYPGNAFFNAPPGFGNASGNSPTFPSAFPFFNETGVGNLGQTSIPQQDAEALTSGPLMSPTANNLLPSNLLGDDDVPNPAYNNEQTAGGPSFGPSYRLPNIDTSNRDPQSPLSIHSRSPSLLSSPQESLSNVQNFHPDRDQIADSERQSLASTGSPYSHPVTATSNPGNSRRISELFNFNRSRGKGSISGLPQLGTLKSSQSQSFPVSLDQDPAPAGTSRRKVGSNGWSNHMASLLARGGGNGGAVEDDSRSSESHGAVPRKARRGMFGSKLDPSEPLVDRSSSPRPSSTYSYDNAFPRLATDKAPFGWPTLDAPRQRGSYSGSDWPASIGPSWSRNPSRRQSLAHGSTSNLSIGSTPLDPDDYSSPYGGKVSHPAPIGTERFRRRKQSQSPQDAQHPQDSQPSEDSQPTPHTPSQGKSQARSHAPKLNPAAPSFTTRLFARNESKRTPKHEKHHDASDKSRGSKDADGAPPTGVDDSPPLSRRSRDSHSITTAASIAESHDSLEPTSSNAHSETAGPAGPAAGSASSAPKESLMQRITRKSSSSKFGIPWKDRANMFGGVGKKGGGGGEQPSTPGETGGEEETGSDYLGSCRGADSTGGTPVVEKAGRTSLSWSRVMGKGKGRRGEVEVSETEGGEEEDDE